MTQLTLEIHSVLLGLAKTNQHCPAPSHTLGGGADDFLGSTCSSLLIQGLGVASFNSLQNQIKQQLWQIDGGICG